MAKLNDEEIYAANLKIKAYIRSLERELIELDICHLVEIDDAPGYRDGVMTVCLNYPVGIGTLLLERHASDIGDTLATAARDAKMIQAKIEKK